MCLGMNKKIANLKTSQRWEDIQRAGKMSRKKKKDQQGQQHDQQQDQQRKQTSEQDIKLKPSTILP